MTTTPRFTPMRSWKICAWNAHRTATAAVSETRVCVLAPTAASDAYLLAPTTAVAQWVIHAEPSHPLLVAQSTRTHAFQTASDVLNKLQPSAGAMLALPVSFPLKLQRGASATLALRFFSPTFHSMPTLENSAWLTNTKGNDPPYRAKVFSGANA